jgi:acyl carrier protein
LREALKRCSPATYYAACKFRQFGGADPLRAVVLGVIERFVERELRPKLSPPDDALRLSADLGLDSLTMMEIVMIAEEVLRITVTNEELTQLRTLGEVQAFIWAKAQAPRPPDDAGKKSGTWGLTEVGDDVRRVEAAAARGTAGSSN